MTLSFSSLSGGTSFTVVTSTGGSKTATLDKSYPAGTYLIESKAMDTNLEVYLGASDGTQVGTAAAGAKTITASSSFLYVTTINADANDAVIFTLKSASTLTTKTDAVWAPPTITDITPSGLPNANDTTTITGTNFATNVDVKFRKSDDSTLVNAKTTVRGSATSIIATRPDSFAPGDAPYDVIITNPSTNLTATSLNAITAGAVPVWVTSTTLNSATLTQLFSQTISATDADGGSSITYAIVSGALPTGLSLNTSTGAITGTPTGSTGTYTITISATDSGGNTVNRTFTQALNASVVLSEVIRVAGGGGGGGMSTDGEPGGGGGGAGGLVYTNNVAFSYSTTYTVTVGAGGAAGPNTTSNSPASQQLGGPGNDSNITGGVLSLVAATGGGGGARGSGVANYVGNGGNGGCGGGASRSGTPGTGSQGFNGGNGQANSKWGGGGGGGMGGTGGAGGTGNGGEGGIGTNSYSAWASATSSGVSGYFAGGGGGGITLSGTPGNGGLGGGGAGATNTNTATAGTSNTGGGGGGCGSNSSEQKGAAAAGGSGIVLLRTPGSITASSTTGSPTRYETGGYTYYKFLNNGTITF